MTAWEIHEDWGNVILGKALVGYTAPTIRLKGGVVERGRLHTKEYSWHVHFRGAVLHEGEADTMAEGIAAATKAIGLVILDLNTGWGELIASERERSKTEGVRTAEKSAKT
jgi:hypothetical protein